MKSAFKTMAEKSASKMGYKIIPNWRRDSFALADHLRELFEAFSIDTVIDVGANEGQYHDFLRSEVRYLLIPSAGLLNRM